MTKVNFKLKTNIKANHLIFQNACSWLCQEKNLSRSTKKDTFSEVDLSCVTNTKTNLPGPSLAVILERTNDDLVTLEVMTTTSADRTRSPREMYPRIIMMINIKFWLGAIFQLGCLLLPVCFCLALLAARPRCFHWHHSIFLTRQDGLEKFDASSTLKWHYQLGRLCHFVTATK